jgi:hypothetical protein
VTHRPDRSGESGFSGRANRIDELPDDARRSVGLGAQPCVGEPVYAGVVLAEPPPAVEGLEVRPVATFEEFAAEAARTKKE